MKIYSKSSVIEGQHRIKKSGSRAGLTKMKVILGLFEMGLPPQDIIEGLGFSKHYVYRLHHESGYSNPIKKCVVPKPEKKREDEVDTLELQLMPKEQERYLHVVAYRQWCFTNNVEWTSAGLNRFLKRYPDAGKKKNTNKKGKRPASGKKIKIS